MLVACLESCSLIIFIFIMAQQIRMRLASLSISDCRASDAGKTCVSHYEELQPVIGLVHLQCLMIRCLPDVQIVEACQDMTGTDVCVQVVLMNQVTTKVLREDLSKLIPALGAALTALSCHSYFNHQGKL